MHRDEGEPEATFEFSLMKTFIKLKQHFTMVNTTDYSQGGCRRGISINLKL